LRKALAGLALALLLPAAACGFEPLHGRASAVSQRLAQVDVAPIADRAGQLVRNRLLDYFEPPSGNVPALYRLDVDVSEAKDGLAIEEDRTVTRFNLRLQATYRLLRIATGQALLEGETNALAAYNVIRSDYANLIAERDARARAAQDIGDAIGLRVAVTLRPGS
jgi:LPS-assembly lipoprotein